MRIAVFSNENPETACARLRLRSPLAAPGTGVELRWATRRDGYSARIDYEAIDWADLIVIQRFFPTAATAPVLERIFAADIPTVYEIDDLLTEIPAYSPQHDQADLLRPHALALMERADAVTVTTAALADAYRPHARRVIVLPNLVDTGVWPAPLPRGDGPVLIGYCGTDSHRAELESIEPALLRLARLFGDRVSLRFMGCVTPALAALPNSRAYPFTMDYAAYARTLAELGLHIAVAPLSDDRFNRCKSSIKWLEYSACGIAGVYARVGPYADAVRNGETGFLVSAELGQWERTLERLVVEPELRRTVAENARREVLEKHTVAAAGEAFVSAYRGVVEHRRNVAVMAAAGGGMRPARDAGSLPVQILTVCGIKDGVSLADTLDSLAVQSRRGWRWSVVADCPAPDPLFAQLDNLEWIDAAGNLPGAIERVLSGSGAEWVVMLPPGGTLHGEALPRLLGYAQQRPDLSLIYTDEACLEADGSLGTPLLKPDFNLELLRSTPYVGACCMVRRDVLRALPDCVATSAAGVTDLVLRVFESRGADAIGHLPDVLYLTKSAPPVPAEASALEAVVANHLRRCGIEAGVHTGYRPGTLFVDYGLRERPLVTIIIPTRNAPDYIGPCLSSLLAKTTYPNFEVLVMDNGSDDPAALAVLEQAQRAPRVRVMRWPQPYNFAAINNAAARQARGDYLLLLNNDTLVVHDNWLERMLLHALHHDVGIVGARLVFPDQRIQHAGVVLGMGPNGVAEHPFMGLAMTEAGYMGMAQVAREVSAVTGACLLIGKQLYDRVGGLDQDRLAVMYNDVDLCLKVRELGLRIIWTPFATLVHHGSASVKVSEYKDPKKMVRRRGEMDTMLQRWLPRLANDPYYNPRLSLFDNTCSVDPVLWAPGGGATTVLALAGGSDGSAEFRVGMPLETLRRGRHGVDARVIRNRDGKMRIPTVTEVARLAPDALLAHNAVHEAQLEVLDYCKRFTDTFLVWGQDDLLDDLPKYNAFRTTAYPDIKRRLRRGISTCDRLLVTTPALADTYRAWAKDIRVLPNYLRRDVWGRLRSARRTGPKPRVGWAGAQQHSGDLAVILDVVKETAAEIQWVFFGLCFEEWLTFGVEVHDPVPFGQYPETLAELNLDLAVAPLAHNRFNQCKSNLKVLEYGALGIPVVCTDIEPYRNAPVTRVGNTARAWVAAIREQVQDSDAAAREGDCLRCWVHEHWMLEDHLDEWMEALQLSDRVVPSRAAAGAG